MNSPAFSSPPPISTLNASIHIGASAISLLVMDSASDSTENQGDVLEQSIPIARDIFQYGRIRKSTIERCVKILNGYLDALKELGGNDDTPIRAVVTNLLNEAQNQEVFLNRIRIGCSLQIEPLDEGEMTRLIYLKTRRRLRDTPSMKTKTTLVVHVGPGNTRALLFKQGRIAQYSNYRLGVYRTSEAISETSSDTTGFNDAPSLSHPILEHASSQINQIQHTYAESGIEEIVIIGYEIQHIAHLIVKPGKTKTDYLSLQQLSSQLANMTEEMRVKKYQLDSYTAQAVIPALEINLAIANALNVKTLRIPGSDYERGLLHDIPTSFHITDGFRNEVIRSAKTLAQRYRVHKQHSIQVARLSQIIFDATTSLHQLDKNDSLLLKCAAIVHECGNFISPRSHHEHSQHIILHSEIFGLAQKDIIIISQIARYHRKSSPKISHIHYRELTTTDRMRVSKLASILRIADALDHSHNSRVGDIKVDIDHRKQKLLIELIGLDNISIERIAMKNKANLFEDIFGLAVTPREGDSSQF